MSKKMYIWTGGVAVVLLLIVIGTWFLFPSSPAPTQTNNAGGSFGTSANNSTGGTVNNTAAPNTNGTQTTGGASQPSQQKIFQITPGPVVGATLIQTLHPTTTIARYIKQEDGHVFDLPLDVPGAVPRMVSNVTIPGGARAIWVEGGNAAVMQYLDGNIVKSVYLGFPVSTSTSVTLPTRIRFLPDAIVDIAASPDGKSVVYLLKTSSGVDGYISKSDGTSSKKVFSFPLSQMLISWPSQSFMLAQTKPAAGVPGMVFSVDTKSGTVTSLVYAQGVTATADRTFSHVVYQTASQDESGAYTYAHDIKTGNDSLLAGFDPFPETCLWSSISTTVTYCALPIAQYPKNYLDLWHEGLASLANNILSFNVASGKVSVVAIPGSVRDGGVQSDILEMALSPNERYLSFTTRGNRAVWGVRLPQ